ncbi:MAG: hypothetical protein HY606_05890 [Planctomycetes bacterium]|nr:hypothetical protein [Planctomycetota bacterium]
MSYYCSITKEIRDKEKLRLLTRWIFNRLSSVEAKEQYLNILADAREVSANTNYIAMFLSESHESLLEKAIRTVGYLKALEYSEKVAAYLNPEDNSSNTIKAAALCTIAKLGIHEHTVNIAKFLRHKSDLLRYNSIKTLVSLNEEGYTGDIVALLDDRCYGVKLEAIKAIGHFRATEYTDKIESILNSFVTGRTEADFGICREAVNTITKLVSSEVSKHVVVKLLDNEIDFRIPVYAMSKLAEIGAREYAQKIAGFLADMRAFDGCSGGTNCEILMSGVGVAGYACRALAKLGAREHSSEIASLLTSNEWWAPIEATRALAELDAKEYIPQLCKLFKESNTKEKQRLREVVKESLEKLGYSESEREKLSDDSLNK